MLVETLSTPWRLIRYTSATDNGFPSRLIRATEPSGVGDSAAQATASAVFDLASQGPLAQNAAVLKFFGAGSNNNTFSVRVIGWSKIIKQGNENTAEWDPTVLCQLDVTLSSTPIGLAGKVVADTDLFADTIAINGTTANAGISIDVVSPANDSAGYVTLDLKGCQKVEVIFTTGGSATNCNGLIRFI